MKKRIFVLIIYLLFAISLCTLSFTFSKYVSTSSTEVSAQVGEMRVYYIRGEIFRGSEQVISETEIDSVTGESSLVINNVKPGDELKYTFFIKNYLTDSDNNIIAVNAVNAKYKMILTATWYLPVRNITSTIPCAITKFDSTNNTYMYFDPSVYTNVSYCTATDQSTFYSEKFRLAVDLDNQIYTADDYFGAKLIIQIQIIAEQVIA